MDDGNGGMGMITCQVHFPTSASLDDLLQGLCLYSHALFVGEVHVTLRNDFNIPHMNLDGRIDSIVVAPSSLSTTTTTSSSSSSPQHQKLTLVNGSFPPRYKTTFVRHRPDRISEIWKGHFDELTLRYIPSQLVAVVPVPSKHLLIRMTANLFTFQNRDDVILYYKVISSSFEEEEEEEDTGITATAGPDLDRLALFKEAIDGYREKDGWSRLGLNETSKSGTTTNTHPPSKFVASLAHESTATTTTSSNIYSIFLTPPITPNSFLCLGSSVRVSWQGTLEKRQRESTR
jgi:hypothetical protein